MTGPSGFFEAAARLIVRRPWRVLAIGAALTLGFVALAVFKLELKTGRGELVDPEIPWQKRYLELKEVHGDLDSIVVAITGPDRARSLAYAEALEARVLAEPELFKGVFYRVRPEDFGDAALLFLTEAAVDRIDESLERNRQALKRGPLAGALAALGAEVDAIIESGSEGDKTDLAAPALDKVLDGLIADLDAASQDKAIAEPAWSALEGGGRERGTSWIGDSASLLCLVSSRRTAEGTDPSKAAVKRLRVIVAELARERPQIEVGLTGKPVLQVDEIKTYTRDSKTATLIGLAGCLVLVILALRRLLAPLLIGGCLLLAIVWSLGAAALSPGHLNLLSVVFVVVIIGLGADFGLHLIARYDEQRAGGQGPEDALAEALRHTGAATSVGAITTALAFIATLFTDFKGMRELGIIAGQGVALALVIMLSLLPPMIVLIDRLRPGSAAAPTGPSRFWSAVAYAPRRFPGLVLLAGLLLSAASLAALPSLGFRGNLLELQDPTLPSVQLELALLKDKRLSSWFLCFTTADPAELARVEDRLAALPSVRKTESIRAALPPNQEARLAALRRLAATWSSLDAMPERSSKAALLTGFSRAIDALERAGELAFKAERIAAADRLDRSVEGLLAVRERVESGGVSAGLIAYESRLRAEVFAGLLKGLGEGAARAKPLSLEGLPAGLRDRFIGRGGHSLLRIYAAAGVGDERAMADFIEEVQAAEPRVTGVPILVRESSRLMVESYKKAAWIALIIIAAFLLLSFRRVLPTLLALVALLVGGSWTIGAMVLIGLDFNPANLIALPLLLGIGIDYSVHIVHRFFEEVGRDRGREPASLPLVETAAGRAVWYSGLTSAVGFGALISAHHQGMASIGAAIALGILCALASALLFLPAMLYGLWACAPKLIDGVWRRLAAR